MKNTAIIGASASEERYSNRAQKMLTEHGHPVFPVNPYGGEVYGVPCFTSPSQITEPIDTVTIYVAPKRLADSIDEIIALKPKRIIFNPGTEDDQLISKVRSAGIDAVTACTLVMLSTNQF